MSDFNYDPSQYAADSAQWEQASTGLWDISIDFNHMADQEWIEANYDMANQLYDFADNAEFMSNEAYQQSWDAWYGPINAEGYTAHDAAMGYTSMDTSFIEPASAAGSCSMIADYSTNSEL